MDVHLLWNELDRSNHRLVALTGFALAAERVESNYARKHVAPYWPDTAARDRTAAIAQCLVVRASSQFDYIAQIFAVSPSASSFNKPAWH